MQFSKVGCCLALISSVFCQGDEHDILGSIAEAGSLQYDLTIYQDAGFTTVHDQSVHGPFVVGTELFFQVDAAVVLPGISFSLLSCQVKNTDETLSYKIIENLCPDATVNTQILGATQSSSSLKGSYNVFEFITDAESSETNTIHLSCEVILCSDSDPSSSCATGCVEDSGRRRRSLATVSFDAAVVKATEQMSLDVSNLS